MRTALLVLSSALAAASAGIFQVHLPVTYALNPLPIYNQAQNTLTGEYAYNYAGGPSSKEEIKTADGLTRGAYNYVDGFGIVQSANYVADKNGFRVSATNLPSEAEIGVNVPFDTPEIAAAKAAHFAEHAKAVASLNRRKRGLSYVPYLGSDSGSGSAVSSRYEHRVDESVSLEGASSLAPVYRFEEYFPAAALVPPTHASFEHPVPISVSHQSRIQTHGSSRVEIPAAVVGALEDQVISYQEEPSHVAAVSSAPTAVSSQSRYQVHTGNKIEVGSARLGFSTAPGLPAVPLVPANELGRADAAIVDTFGAAVTLAEIPTAVSSQSRVQHHSDARLEIEVEPIASGNRVVDSYGHPVVIRLPESLEVSKNLVYGSSRLLVSQLPVDTPEVAAAKRKHAEAYAAELAKHQGW